MMNMQGGQDQQQQRPEDQRGTGIAQPGAVGRPVGTLTVGASQVSALAFSPNGSVLAAAIVGIIGITPAGLGVREGALVALLAETAKGEGSDPVLESERRGAGARRSRPRREREDGSRLRRPGEGRCRDDVSRLDHEPVDDDREQRTDQRTDEVGGKRRGDGQAKVPAG